MTDAEVLHELYRSVIMLAGVVALWAVLTTVLHFQVRSLRRTVRALVAMRVTDPAPDPRPDPDYEDPGMPERRPRGA